MADEQNERLNSILPGVVWYRDGIILFNIIMAIASVLFWLLFQQSRWAEIAMVFQGIVNILLRVFTVYPLVMHRQTDLNRYEQGIRNKHTSDIDAFIKRGREDNE